MTLWPYPTTACGESRLIWKSRAASRTPNEVLDFWESAVSKLWWLYFGRGEPLQPTGTECAPKRRLGITEGAAKARSIRVLPRLRGLLASDS
jgi:hypothetical protein